MSEMKSLVGRPGDLRSNFASVPCEDEFKGVPDQLLHEVIAEAAVEIQGVPMPFVHMVTRTNGLVFLSELNGTVWVALEVHRYWHSIRAQDCEHLPGDLVDGCLGSKWKLLSGLGVAEEVKVNMFEIIHGQGRKVGI